MTTTAAGRIIFILFVGLFVGLCLLGTPARAACTSDACTDKARAESKPTNLKKYAKTSVRLAHRSHRRHLHRIVSRHKQDPDKEIAVARAEINGMSARIADARAEMTSVDMGTRTDAGKAKSEKTANSAPAVENSPAESSEGSIQVVNADELNELDRAAAEGKSRPILSPALANARAEMREDQSSTWAQTSMIGKAFIVIGVMLTFASAARMFVA